MSYTITNVKSDLEGILKGQSTSKLTNISSLLNRAARQVLLDLDPQETKRSTSLALFRDVYDYASPADLKGNKVIDIRPQVNRTTADSFSQNYSEAFDEEKSATNYPKFQVAFESGTKYIRITKPSLKKGTLLDGMTSVLKWAAGGDVTDMTEDTTYYKYGNKSIVFDLDGSGTSGYIENTSVGSIDLSEHEDKSSIFVWVYIPDKSIITKFDLRWGKSASVRWNKTVTEPAYGSFINGWNLLKFDWNGATKTGSPDSSDIDFLRLTITYDGTADTDFRVDEIRSTLPEINEMVYYSKYLFSDGTTGSFKETISTNDDDTVNLDTETYNTFLWKVAEMACQQVPDYGDVSYFKSEYMTSLRRYKSLYKSEVEKPQQTYYKMPRKHNGRRILTP